MRPPIEKRFFVALFSTVDLSSFLVRSFSRLENRSLSLILPEQIARVRVENLLEINLDVE